MNLILLGAPGAGKGTLAMELTALLGIPHISSGDIFRDNIRSRTELGVLAEQYISKGCLVPDDVTIGMMEARLSQADCAAGFILDGYPRTISQALALDTFLDAHHMAIDHVVNIVVTEEELVRRLTNRRVCSACKTSFNLQQQPGLGSNCPSCGNDLVQRADDNPDVIKQRFLTYHTETEPLVQYYSTCGKLVKVRSESEAKETLENVLYALRIKGVGKV